MGFLNCHLWEGHEGPHHNFVVIDLVVMKLGTGVGLDIFYTMVTKSFLRHCSCVIAAS